MAVDGLHGDACPAWSAPPVDGVGDPNGAAIANERVGIPRLLAGIHHGGARALGHVLADEAGDLELGAGFFWSSLSLAIDSQ